MIWKEVGEAEFIFIDKNRSLKKEVELVNEELKIILQLGK